MASQGSPYGRFQRALKTGNLQIIRSAAAELPSVDLGDALASWSAQATPVGSAGCCREAPQSDCSTAHPVRSRSCRSATETT
jgi:hypothetical protein